MQPICCKCRITMRAIKNAFIVRDPEASGFPSTYWSSDKYACPVCGCEIATGFSSKINDEDAENIGWKKLDFKEGKEALEFRYNK
jgi:hypothetical protein